jgi:outer membrane immunogenic protein
MKRFLLATVSIPALTSGTRAADMPAKAPMYAPAPVVDWTGVYLGIQGGAVRRDALAEVGTFGFELDGSKTGGTAGAVLGYNWQHGSFVYGLEGDWSWIGAKTSHLSNLGNVSTSFDVNWLSTTRGRAGARVRLDFALPDRRRSLWAGEKCFRFFGARRFPPYAK